MDCSESGEQTFHTLLALPYEVTARLLELFMRVMGPGMYQYKYAEISDFAQPPGCLRRAAPVAAECAPAQHTTRVLWRKRRLAAVKQLQEDCLPVPDLGATARPIVLRDLRLQRHGLQVCIHSNRLFRQDRARQNPAVRGAEVHSSGG